MSEALITTEQVAAWLGVDDETVRRLIRRKQLPAYKVGNSYRINPKDVEDYLESIRVGKEESAEKK